MKPNLEKILLLVDKNLGLSSSEIHKSVGLDVGLITIKRYLSDLVSKNLLLIKGKGRATKYFVTPYYKLSHPITIEHYFKDEIDDRDISNKFNLDLISKTLAATNIFSKDEIFYLEE